MPGKTVETTSRITGRLSMCCGAAVREVTATVEFVHEGTKRKRRRVKHTHFCNNCDRSVIS